MPVRSVVVSRALAIGLVSLAVISGCQPAAPPQSAASPAAASSAASPAASPALPPSKPDGIYTPTTNREIYQAISADYQ
jgi:hypothetical protein